MSETNDTTPTTETPDTPEPTVQAAQPDTTDGTDWKAEARKWEQRAKDNKSAATKLNQLEDANKSETEKLNERATKAETAQQEAHTKYVSLLKRQAITDAATTAHSTDTETVYLYLDNEIQIDDDGNVQGLDKAIRDLAKRKPHLFRTTPEGSKDAFSGGTTPPALNSDGITDALRAAVGI